MIVGLHTNTESANSRGLLTRFGNGIRKIDSSIQTVNISATEYIYTDLAVMWGAWKPHKIDIDNASPILRKRNNIAAGCMLSQKPLICIDMPLFKKNNEYRIGLNHYLSYGFKYLPQNPTSNRWDKLGIEIKPWQRSGKYIVLTPEKTRNYGLFGYDGYKWAQHCIKLYSGDRKIIVKTHSFEKAGEDKRMYKLGVDVVKEIDPVDIWSMVSFTSNIAVDSIIKGIPCVATHPASFAYGFITNPVTPETPYRLLFLNRLAHSQYSISEIQNGLPWQVIKESMT